jgi:hypothetical protein
MWVSDDRKAGVDRRRFRYGELEGTAHRDTTVDRAILKILTE